MEKGLGIAALVCAILAIFIPLYGIWVTWIAVAIACVAAFLGDKPFAISTSVIAFVNMVVLTPSINLFSGGERAFAYIVTLAPLVVVALRHYGVIPQAKT
jgi:hypothetical protein